MSNHEPSITVTIRGHLVNRIEHRFDPSLSRCNVTEMDISLTYKDVSLMIAAVELVRALGSNYLSSNFSMVLHSLFGVVCDVRFNGRSIMDELFSIVDPDVVHLGVEVEISAYYVDSREGDSEFGIEMWLVTIPRKEDILGHWFSVSYEELLAWREQLKLLEQGIYTVGDKDG